MTIYWSELQKIVGTSRRGRTAKETFESKKKNFFPNSYIDNRCAFEITNRPAIFSNESLLIVCSSKDFTEMNDG
jgi:hypothetical protein